MATRYKEYLNEQTTIDISKFGKSPKADETGVWEFKDENGTTSFLTNMSYTVASKEIKKSAKTKKVYLISKNKEY